MSPACFIISILNDAKLKSLQALRVHFLLGVRNCQLTYKCRWICHEQITPLILHPNHFHFIGTMSDHCLLLSLTNSCHAYMYSNMVRALMVIQLQPLYEIVRIVMGWNGCWCLHKELYSAVYIPQWQSSVLSLQKFSNEGRKPAFPSNKWQRQNPDIVVIGKLILLNFPVVRKGEACICTSSSIKLTRAKSDFWRTARVCPWGSKSCAGLRDLAEF